MAGKLITDDRRCLHWSTACTSIPNDHFIGTTNANANSRWRNSLEKAMTFFSLWLLFIWLSAPHILSLADDYISYCFFSSCFCLSMPSAVWKLSVFAGSVCVVILLLSFDSGCKCIYWYHQCRVCIFVHLCNGSMREYVCLCVKEKKIRFFFLQNIKSIVVQGVCWKYTNWLHNSGRSMTWTIECKEEKKTIA